MFINENEVFQMNASCILGIEGVLANEVRALGFDNVEVKDGNVFFKGTIRQLIQANLHLRCAGKILVVLGQFKATTFDELFDKVKQLEFEKWIGKYNSFPVAMGHSLRSKLFSLRDCQTIIKKAAAERLKQAYNVNWLEETGSEFKIRFQILNDEVSIYLDSSGASLHKRGYRAHSNAAPIKETLAAAIVYLSRYRGRDLFVDPMCGSGTISIEAAMIAKNIAPGLYRKFAFEYWDCVDKDIVMAERKRAKSLINDKQPVILASDIDSECVKLTQENAKKAGVDKYITVSQKDVTKLSEADFGEYDRGVIICNPPYGERMLEFNQVKSLYEKLGKVFTSLPRFSYYIICADEQFEQFFGRKADKNRKLYNGMIKCYLYQYFK